MEPRAIDETRLTLAHVMLPQDANPAGNVHGGVIMKHIDNAGGVVAVRHARSNAVTASIDRLDFLGPVFVGDLLMLYASINLAGRTSMEVGVRVEAENPITGQRRHTASAYLTFVALDKQGRPHAVPPLRLINEEDRRRNQEAISRRDMRLAEKARERKSQPRD